MEVFIFLIGEVFAIINIVISETIKDYFANKRK
ncbi:unnamed protein product [Fructobacillus evanidus]|uniref:Uncharacterized protein n=1 Tax=Fructobacillus tropaeoli TaxID=709323 RepID=A0ABM9N226_9LACO|nr:unnamed protein product [Fructobacillus tropaeoli]CAK1254458.1 unnamed protein product [Fructobacillus sp. LMG 32999]